MTIQFESDSNPKLNLDFLRNFSRNRPINEKNASLKTFSIKKKKEKNILTFNNKVRFHIPRSHRHPINEKKMFR